MLGHFPERQHLTTMQTATILTTMHTQYYREQKHSHEGPHAVSFKETCQLLLTIFQSNYAAEFISRMPVTYPVTVLQ
jgi:hypothetical protein